MHIHVVGLGSIGCLVAHHLRQSLPLRHTISLLHKNFRSAEAIRRRGGAITVESRGVSVETGAFRHEVVDLQTVPALDPAPDAALVEIPGTAPTYAFDSQAPIESLIVCLKTISTPGAISQLLPRLSSSSTIVLMQNGMGVYEHLVETFFRNAAERPHFVLASINHGALTKRPLHIVHTGNGFINFGIVPDGAGRDFEASRPTLNLNDITPNTPDDPHSERYLSLRNTIAALSSLRTLNCTWNPIYDVHMAMRRKLVVNSVINPLTAVLDCRNGEILKHQWGQNICRQVCREASAVFHAQWKDEISAARSAGKDVASAEFPAVLSAMSLQDECQTVAKLTATNTSSMLADVRMGRTTEIKNINGYLLRLGNLHKIYMPANKMLFDIIRLRENIPISAKL